MRRHLSIPKKEDDLLVEMAKENGVNLSKMVTLLIRQAAKYEILGRLDDHEKRINVLEAEKQTNNE